MLKHDTFVGEGQGSCTQSANCQTLQRGFQVYHVLVSVVCSSTPYPLVSVSVFYHGGGTCGRYWVTNISDRTTAAILPISLVPVGIVSWRKNVCITGVSVSAS